MINRLGWLTIVVSLGFGAYACGSEDRSRVTGPGGDGPGGDGGAPPIGGKSQSGGSSAQPMGGASGRAGTSGTSGGGTASDTGGTSSAGGAYNGAAGEAAGGAGGSSIYTGGAANAGAPGELGGAGGVGGASNSCDLGAVSSSGTNENLNLFGDIVYFANGAPLPAGHYRVSYLDGCMKYGGGQDWTVHAYANANPDGWLLVGDTTADHVAVPPGTVGWSTANGAFATFDECVTANLALPPVEFDFAGGKLGVWLQDSPYTDNMAGQDNRNPKWELTLMGECPTQNN